MYMLLQMQEIGIFLIKASVVLFCLFAAVLIILAGREIWKDRKQEMKRGRDAENIENVWRVIHAKKKKRNIIRRQVKNFLIKVFTVINLFSLLCGMCLVDCVVSWKTIGIMLVNFLFLCLVTYANGYVYDTKPYYERLQRQRRKHG